MEPWAESYLVFALWVVHYLPVVKQLFKERDRLVKEATVALEARNARIAEQGAFPRIHARVEALIGDEEVSGRERKKSSRREEKKRRGDLEKRETRR